MPDTDPVPKIQFAATPAYRRFILRVNASLRKAGLTVPEGDLSATVELCVNLTGFAHGLLAPPRVPNGKGGKRAGAGRPKKVTETPAT
jgi:hypothetical protein